jgi:hypothetical protein
MPSALPLRTKHLCAFFLFPFLKSSIRWVCRFHIYWIKKDKGAHQWPSFLAEMSGFDPDGDCNIYKFMLSSAASGHLFFSLSLATFQPWHLQPLTFTFLRIQLSKTPHSFSSRLRILACLRFLVKLRPLHIILMILVLHIIILMVLVTSPPVAAHQIRPMWVFSK